MNDRGHYRSGLEAEIGRVLEQSGLVWYYEDGPCKISYTMPVRSAKCGDCQSTSVLTDHKYTADFAFITRRSGKLIIIEVKGHYLGWTGGTRNKHQQIKKQFPDMDLRFVFSNVNAYISKSSKTTNKQWADRQGFPVANRLIPLEWLDE